MNNSIVLEDVEQLAEQLEPAQQLKLVAYITEQMSKKIFGNSVDEDKARQARKKKLQLCEELLEEVSDITDDSQGFFDASETINRLRDERISEICSTT